MGCDIAIAAPQTDGITICFSDDDPSTFAPCQAGNPTAKADFYRLAGGREVCADHPAVVRNGLSYQSVDSATLLSHLLLRRQIGELVKSQTPEATRIVAARALVAATSLPPVFQQVRNTALLQALRRDASSEVKFTIAMGFDWSTAGVPPSDVALAGDVLGERLRGTVPSGDFHVRFDGGKIAEKLGGKSFRRHRGAIDALRVAATSSPDVLVQEKALGALFDIDEDPHRVFATIIGSLEHAAKCGETNVFMVDDLIARARQFFEGGVVALRGVVATEGSGPSSAEWQRFSTALVSLYFCLRNEAFHAARDIFADALAGLPSEVRIEVFSQIVRQAYTRGDTNGVLHLLDKLGADYCQDHARAAREVLEDAAARGDEWVQRSARENLTCDGTE